MLISAIGWWYAWRRAQHGKDEALRYFTAFIEQFPIPTPATYQREHAAAFVRQLIELSAVRHRTRGELLDWLRVEHNIEKAGLKLQSPTELDSDAFVAEVKRVRGKKNPLSAAALKSLRDEYTRTIEPARAAAAEALRLERRLSDLVNEAYGLTPEEVALMWQTAPPRMPLAGP